MQLLSLLSLLTATAVANPIKLAAVETVGKRQAVGVTANQLEDDACRKITFIFARGSTEVGNLVSIERDTTSCKGEQRL